mmetsp:Transcript_5685/g.7976  ORF Transcript_5685/g.7976 Transcript_5685/m.7976 type:complete len:476 (-) Transcript_5685:270-1697(-)
MLRRTWRGAKKIKLQLQTTLNVHHVNTASDSIIFGWNGLTTPAIPTGGSGQVIAVSAVDDELAQIPVSISTSQGGTVYAIEADLRDIPCTDSNLNNVFVYPLAQTEAITQSWNWNFFIPDLDNECRFFFDNDVRVTMINLAQAPGRMFFSEFIQSPDENGRVHESFFPRVRQDEGRFDVGHYDFDTDANDTGTNGLTLYAFFHYRVEETGDSTCRRCALTMSQSSSGTAFFVFWGGTNSISLRSITNGAGITAACTTTNRCVSTDSGSDEPVCFAEDSNVELESGEVKRIKDVRIGESVQVTSTNGTVGYSPVAFLPHKENQIEAEFVIIMTEKGKTIRATRNHLIIASKDCDSSSSSSSSDSCENISGFTRAEDVTTNMCVCGVEGQDRVVAVEFGARRGVYTIVTTHADGVIVVDGVRASSFGTNHGVVNAYYHIHRALYYVLPSWMLESELAVGVNTMVGDLASLLMRIWAR